MQDQMTLKREIPDKVFTVHKEYQGLDPETKFKMLTVLRNWALDEMVKVRKEIDRNLTTGG